MENKTTESTIYGVLFGIVGLIFVLVQVSAINQASILSGESALLSNVVIDYVRDGDWHYPVHAQEYFFPGIDVFMIHPPLHYLLSAIWVKLFGIGIWQLHLQSAIAGVFGVLLATGIVYRIYGVSIAIFVPALAATSVAYVFGTTEYRPDMSFGLVYSLTVVLFGILLTNALKQIQRIALGFLFGVLAVASLATHWFGYFVQLYLIVYGLLMLWRYQWRGMVVIGSCAAGWCFAIALWHVFFDGDLIASMIVVVIRGNDFLTSIGNPIGYAMQFLTDWDGGVWLSLGMGLGFMFGICTLYLRVVMGVTLSLKQVVPLFLSLNLLAYFLFFYFFVGNKSPQYAGNILLLALPLAAIGFGQSLASFFNFIKRREFLVWATTIVLFATFANSLAARKYLAEVPAVFASAQHHYNSARKAMGLLVPERLKLLAGGNTYPYLFDRDYVSTMALVAKHTLPQPRDLNLTEIIPHYRKMSASQYIRSPYPNEDRKRALENFDVIALADTGHSWQYLFYDPQVWEEDFQEVGTLVVPAPSVRRSHFYPGQDINYPRTHYVLQRVGLPIDSTLLTSSPRILAFDDGTIIITPGPGSRHGFSTGEKWKALDVEDQKLQIAQYLDFLNWYGASINQEEKNKVVERVYPHVSYYLNAFDGRDFNSVMMKRSLAQALDYAFAVTGYPDVLPRVPQDEWMQP